MSPRLLDAWNGGVPPEWRPAAGAPRLRALRRVVGSAAFLWLLVVLLSGVPWRGAPAGAASRPTDYARPGPYRTVQMELVAPDGSSFAVFRPASYAALSFPSPIVTWGNGTGATPADYVTLLGHLASWGFTVVASVLPDTGSGVQILDGARQLVTQDHRARSVFFHHLATAEIAAMGHSQGATGAVRAAELGGRLVHTVVTFSLPWNGQGPTGSTWDRTSSQSQPLGWSAPNPDCATARDCWPDPAKLHQPTFLISTRGTLDSVIANAAVERCYFQEVKAPAAYGLVRLSDGKTADHSSIQDSAQGGNPGAFVPYVTAWLLAELRHDSGARALFFGQQASLVHSANWSGSEVKRAPSPVRHCG